MLNTGAPGGGGGGGGVLPYVCILGMCRRRDPHFQPWISVPEHIIFTNYQKSVPEHHHFTFFGGFCCSGDHYFLNSLISTRSSLPTASSARTQSIRQRRGIAAVLEIRIFTLKADQARSGALHNCDQWNFKWSSFLLFLVKCLWNSFLLYHVFSSSYKGMLWFTFVQDH